MPDLTERFWPARVVLVGLETAGRMAERLPGAGLARAGLDSLRDRLEQLNPEPGSADGTGTTGAQPDRPSPAQMLAQLLEQAATQSADDARDALFTRVVSELVPDEAKLLGSMSDGTGHALIHLEAGSPLGGAAKRALSNVTSAGDLASLRFKELAPLYISHLDRLGLVDIGPEDPDMALEYEMLEASGAVRGAIETIEQQRLTKARVCRHTVQLSELGRALWACTSPEAADPADPADPTDPADPGDPAQPDPAE